MRSMIMTGLLALLIGGVSLQAAETIKADSTVLDSELVELLLDLHKGTWIRAKTKSARYYQGAVIKTVNDSLELLQNASLHKNPIWRGSIAEIDVVWKRTRKTSEGFFIGTMTGLAAGILIMSSDNSDQSDFILDHRLVDAFVLTVSTLTGGLLGLLIGHETVKYDLLYEVPSEQQGAVQSQYLSSLASAFSSDFGLRLRVKDGRNNERGVLAGDLTVDLSTDLNNSVGVKLAAGF